MKNPTEEQVFALLKVERGEGEPERMVGRYPSDECVALFERQDVGGDTRWRQISRRIDLAAAQRLASGILAGDQRATTFPGNPMTLAVALLSMSLALTDPELFTQQPPEGQP